jgi:hypothetical protein
MERLADLDPLKEVLADLGLFAPRAG